MVDHACYPDLMEPNLSLNLEICDLINQKGKSAPREVAMAITRTINRGNQRSAMLALTLLDNCVKNCGYPFHLIISSKEFLNELVRRFPERPTTIGPVQHRILEFIQIWNSTLCVSSRHRNDFKNINDMYRLLAYKGYRFPNVSVDASTILSTKTLKTEEELEEEDKVANGAKLQELLRIGTPAALEQANELMKIMAGYDMDKRPDYKKEVDQELEKIEQKAIILNDLLINKKPEDRRILDPTMEELYGAAKTAQTRIQKMIEEDEDGERIERLLGLNDLINTVIGKYGDFKSGKGVDKSDLSPVAKHKREKTQEKSKPQTSKPAASLIDLDDIFSTPAEQEGGSISLPTGASAMDDLNAIFGSNPASALPSTSIFSPTSFSPSQQAPASSPPKSQIQQLIPDSTHPVPPRYSPQPIQPSGIEDLLGLVAAPNQVAPAPVKPATKDAMLFNKNGLQIKLHMEFPNGMVVLQLVYINTTPVPFNDLVFQVAVPKTMTLKMEPLSSTVIAPLNTAQTTQTMFVNNPTKDPVRLKFRVSYSVNGAVVEEQGEFTEP
ncbi:hypothetical protein HK098_004868 [Nowakowskiella sp. JEL0407]|nr:hypothetical protein HK098_004868 [Nowakowskiella sp. JEL0407]